MFHSYPTRIYICTDNRRTLIDFDEANVLGVPDGMTIDNRDNLWIACWGGSQVSASSTAFRLQEYEFSYPKNFQVWYESIVITHRINYSINTILVSQIINVDSNTGRVLYAIKMPLERVTSVTFGGPYYDTLYVTTMRTGLTQDQLKTQPSAGALFSITNLPVIGNYNNPLSKCARIAL